MLVPVPRQPGQCVSLVLPGFGPGKGYVYDMRGVVCCRKTDMLCFLVRPSPQVAAAPCCCVYQTHQRTYWSYIFHLDLGAKFSFLLLKSMMFQAYLVWTLLGLLSSFFFLRSVQITLFHSSRHTIRMALVVHRMYNDAEQYFTKLRCTERRN